MRMTWDLVVMSPDVSTLWNMRKEFIMIKKDEFDAQLKELKDQVHLNQINDHLNQTNDRLNQTNDHLNQINDHLNQTDDQLLIREIKNECSNLEINSQNDEKSSKTVCSLTEDELIDRFQNLCNDELELTEYALLKNAKSYSAWQHRLWILGLIPRPDFKREFQLNEAYLQKDGRNCMFSSFIESIEFTNFFF